MESTLRMIKLYLVKIRRGSDRENLKKWTPIGPVFKRNSWLSAKARDISVEICVYRKGKWVAQMGRELTARHFQDGVAPFKSRHLQNRVMSREFAQSFVESNKGLGQVFLPRTINPNIFTRLRFYRF